MVHLVRARRVRLDVGALDALEEIRAERHEGVGDDGRVRRIRALVGVFVGDLGEVFEGLEVVERHAVAARIHAPELPLGERVALLGGEFERLDGPDRIARIEVARGAAHGFAGRGIIGGGQARTRGRLEREARPRADQERAERQGAG